MLSVGDRFPMFDLTGIGTSQEFINVSTGDIANGWAVIYFYPKDFTPGCSTQADEFSAEYKKFQKEDIEIIGISPDDVDSHKKFCTKMGIKYTLLSDTGKEVSKAFGVWGMKKFMGREYMGVTRSSFLVNEKGKIFKIYPKVKPAGHAKQVLEDFTK